MIVGLLTGFVSGVILMVIGYNSLVGHYQDTIKDLKSKGRDKDIIIRSLKNYAKSTAPDMESLLNIKDGQEK